MLSASHRGAFCSLASSQERARARAAVARGGSAAPPRALVPARAAAALRSLADAASYVLRLPRLLARAPTDARAAHLRVVQRTLLPEDPCAS
jgi:hypothetical protein